MRLSSAALLLLCTLGVDVHVPSAPAFRRIHALRADEGVFAYSRISPDGRFLAYASESESLSDAGRVIQTVIVVDLQTGKRVFAEPGIDAYWSPDGERMIYLSRLGREPNISIRNHRTGAISRRVAPTPLGDYYSWGAADGQDIILTIRSRYFHLTRENAALPAQTVQACPGIGVGDRPLLSKDGRQLTTFVRGTLVVRDLIGCDHIIQTQVRGAKADFSWDGRYIAFHSPKRTGIGYDIQVIDLRDRTIRTITGFAGSSYFPSWTRDGRLSFRYDGPNYRGFMMATGVLEAPARPLPASTDPMPAVRPWSALFPETRPAPGISLVLVWAPWSAHSPDALIAFDQARDYFARVGLAIGLFMATEPVSLESDIRRMLDQNTVKLQRIPLAPERLWLTEAHSQIPATLLFRDGELLDRRLGAQSFEELLAWVRQAQADE